ncbi:YgiW/YdeI family stress tolerance OB fold protein [Chitiniphilus shinanonensis]|uniref:YgiW/YdeI family stress tolerance OB fold protein n=1 Tax=Chitiniphilus shinanonensis TaxID=553088 RepID=UPI003027D5BF
MKSIKTLAGILALASGMAMAAYVGPDHAAKVTTAADAAKAADDTLVVLEGNIVRKLDKNHYEFRDASGTIKVEIDHDKWPAQDVDAKTRVRLTGEVDKGLINTDVDVKQVEILP